MEDTKSEDDDLDIIYRYLGKYADFVVLDKNILNYQGEELRTIYDTKILSTYFEGKPAYLSE